MTVKLRIDSYQNTIGLISDFFPDTGLLSEAKFKQFPTLHLWGQPGFRGMQCSNRRYNPKDRTAGEIHQLS